MVGCGQSSPHQVTSHLSWHVLVTTCCRGLEVTKEQWESEEASEDVLNNLLRVKKLSQRVSSIESGYQLYVVLPGILLMTVAR